MCWFAAARHGLLPLHELYISCLLLHLSEPRAAQGKQCMFIMCSMPVLSRQLAAAARRGRFGAARAADNAQRLEEVGAKVCTCCLASANLESWDSI
jgi:hypothetical protein